jgi:Ni/Co efflux regulator RcnB
VTPELWATIVVAVIGVAGTLAAALLTQANANRLEEERWNRQREHEKDQHERARAQEHDQWLRDTRHEVYGELIRASSRFFTNMLEFAPAPLPLISCASTFEA